jgi:Icc protein
VIVAHISDLHIKRRGHVLAHMPHVAGPLRRTLAAINALAERPTCIVATGDLTESGNREEYRRLREIIAESEIPVYLLPGNHDRREMMRAVFPDHAYLHGAGQAIQYAIESEFLRVVALDSSDPPLRGGFLDESRLCWLVETLQARPRTPTILAMHHPPFHTGVGAFDAQPFEGRERLADIVREHPQIRRIICGHVHQVLWRPWSGTFAISAPSTAPTLALHARGALRWEPGGLLLHAYDWDADISTTLVRFSAEPVAVGA